MMFRTVNVGESDVLVFLHTQRNPTRAEWGEVKAALEQYASAGDLQRMRVLAVSDGGGPDSVMRGELQNFYKAQRHTLRTAVVTSAVVSRSIVAALSWINPHIKSFAPGQFAEALRYLGVPLSALPALKHELAAMQRELAPVACLARMHEASKTTTSA